MKSIGERGTALLDEEKHTFQKVPQEQIVIPVAL